MYIRRCYNSANGRVNYAAIAPGIYFMNVLANVSGVLCQISLCYDACYEYVSDSET